MSADEKFDIFNDKMQQIGVASRQDTHRQGLWHQSFQCWILKGNAADGWHFLFQLRQHNKDVFPDLLDISCAGHLSEGEKVQDGVRELEEELGLGLSIHELYPCGVIAVEHNPSKLIIDREFCHVYLYKDDRACNMYSFQRSEIKGLFHVPYEAFKQLIRGEIASLLADGIELTDPSEQDTQEVCKEVFVNDFVPHPKQYYEFIFANADQFIGKKIGIDRDPFV